MNATPPAITLGAFPTEAMMTDNMAAETPMIDHIVSALELMRQGARMNLSSIPGDSSMLSATFSSDTTKALAAWVDAHTSERATLAAEAALSEARAEGMRAAAAIASTFVAHKLMHPDDKSVCLRTASDLAAAILAASGGDGGNG